MQTTFKVHWLSTTIWGDKGYGQKMWEVWFEEFLGPLIPTGHGARGFRSLSKALLEAKLYAEPVAQQAVPDNSYFSLEFPGDACDTIPDKLIQEFLLVLDRWEKAKITRLDLAWDGVAFTPDDVKVAVEKDQIRSYISRKSLTFTTSPFENREDGQIGTSSVRLGSNYSSRLLRVYDKHGPVRVEFQSRQKRSDLIARDVLTRQPHEWFDPAIGHLRDYIDFQNPETDELLSWWDKFIAGRDRALKTVSDSRTVELNRMIAWVENQVSPTLSVLADVIGDQSIEAFIVSGRRKRGRKFRALLDKQKEGREK